MSLTVNKQYSRMQTFEKARKHLNRIAVESNTVIPYLLLSFICVYHIALSPHLKYRGLMMANLNSRNM